MNARRASRGFRDRASRTPRLWWIVGGGALILLLACLIVWLLWPEPARELHLILVDTPQQDLRAAPPIAYGPAALSQLASDRGHVHIESQRFDDASRSLSTQLPGRKNDRLLIYLSAHGVSQSGEAYLAAGDYSHFPLPERSGDRGRKPIAEVLQDLADHPAAIKLLLLDWGRIIADAPLAMPVNECHRLLHEAVAELDAPNLWVLVSNAPLQPSLDSHHDQQTLFCLSVLEGLQGKANLAPMGDEDKWISLGELLRYVHYRCAMTSGALQTPMLMQGGKGIRPLEPAEYNEDRYFLTRDPTTLDVVSTADEAPPAEEKESGKAGERSEAEANRDTVGAADETAAGSADTTSPTAPPAVEDGKDVTAKTEPAASPPPSTNTWTIERYLKLLDEGWTIRDRLQREPRVGHAPHEFAPNLWRAVNESLLRYEQLLPALEAEISAGPAGDQADAKKEGVAAAPPLAGNLLADRGQQLSDIVERLTELSRLIRDRRSFDVGVDPRGDFQDRLLVAWNRQLKQDNDLAAKRPRLAKEDDSTEELMRDYRLTLFALPYIIRWHGRETLAFEGGGYGTPARFQAIQQLLASAEQVGSAAADFHRAFPEGDASLDALQRLAQTARQLHDAPDAFARAFLANNPSQAEPEIRQLKIENLLSTPLLTAPRRKQLIEQLRNLQLDSGPWSGQPPAFSTSNALLLTPTQWSAVKDLAILEAAWLELPTVAAVAGGSTARVAVDQLPLLRKVNSINPLAAPDPQAPSLWAEFREIGNSIEQGYLQAADELRAAAVTSADAVANERQTMLLAVLDPRQAPLDTATYPLPLNRFWYQPPDDFKLLVSNGPVQLTRDAPQRELLVTLRGTQRQFLQTEVTPVISPMAGEDWIEVVRSGPVPNLRPGSQGADGWYEQQQQWTVRLRRDALQPESSPPPLYLTFSAAGQPGQVRQSDPLELQLPGVNKVELRFFPEPLTLTDQGQDRIVLLPYPNRRTMFQGRLSNRSRETKKLVVELYRLPWNSTEKPGHSTLARRQAAFDEAARVVKLADTWRIAMSAPLELPAGQEGVLDFSPPAPANPPASADNAATSSTPAPPAAAPSAAAPEQAESGGLLCLIRNLNREAENWHYWIEFKPLRPRDYLSAEPSYDELSRQVRVSVGPRAALPPGEAVNVIWDTRELGGRLGEFSAELTPQRPTAELFAERVDPISRVQIFLDVDRYPRAFAFSVRGAEELLNLFENEKQQRIRLNRITDPSLKRIYDWTPPTAAELEQADPAYERIALSPDQPAIIDARRRDELQLGFEADAPGDVFPSGDASDRIELRLGNQVLGEFRADRHMRVHVEAGGPDMALAVETQVRDFVVPLRTPQIIGPRRLTAIMIAHTPPRALRLERPEDADVRLLFDQDAPTVVIRATSLQHVLGIPLEFSVDVRDESGAAQIEYGWADAAGALPDNAKMQQAFPYREPEGTLRTYPLSIKTDGLTTQSRDQRRLLVRVTDFARRQGQTSAVVELIAPPEEPPAKGDEKAPPEPAYLVIQLFTRSDTAIGNEGFKVTLQGPKNAGPLAYSSANSGYPAGPLPPGQYTIQAEGRLFASSILEGSTTVQLQAGQRKTEKLTVAKRETKDKGK